MKVYSIGWALIIVAILISMTTKIGQEAETEIYASWIIYTVGVVLVAAPRKHKMFQNIS
jgi:uncharacterized membrane protein YczE